MSLARFLTLIFGPVVLLTLAHALTLRHAEPALAAASSVSVDPIPRASDSWLSLPAACERTAEKLRIRLSPRCNVIVSSPFVIAGDRSPSELDKFNRETIQPVAQVLWSSYFDRRPDLPVSIVMLSDEKAYRREARRLDGQEVNAYFGYYQRDDRRIVVNLATGEGTLAHEMTHALSHVDFPEMPEWFDEGLAALHEESDFSEDGLQLKGLQNWRLSLLHDAQRRNRLPALSSVFAGHSFRGEGEGLNYALVRYFCMYLQERQLLSRYYREFRNSASQDPTGVVTLRRVMGRGSAANLDRDFQKWLRTLTPPPRQ